MSSLKTSQRGQIGVSPSFLEPGVGEGYQPRSATWTEWFWAGEAPEESQGQREKRQDQQSLWKVAVIQVYPARSGGRPPPRRGVYVWGRAGVYKVLEQ